MYHNLISLPPRNVRQERLDEMGGGNADMHLFLRVLVYPTLLKVAEQREAEKKWMELQEAANLAKTTIGEHATGVADTFMTPLYGLVPKIANILVTEGDAARTRRCEALF